MTNYSVGDDWRVRVNGREQHPLPHVHVQFRDGSRVSLIIELGQARFWSAMSRPGNDWDPGRTWIEAHREVLLMEYRRLNP